jgi:carboxyl-terminal processing protease
MHRILRSVICTLALMVTLGTSVVADEPSTESFQSERFLEIMQAVQDHHIDPPSNQQMILSGVRALYETRDSRPNNLSKQISALSSNEQFAAFLDTCRKELITPENEVQSCERFINGMFSCVPGNPSRLPAKEAKVRSQLEANRYVGIGISLTQVNGAPQIFKSMYGGSGYKAGVRSNDFILEINGSSTQGKTLNQIVDELRGDEGTEVTLVLRQPEQSARTLTIERQVTFIPTIEGTRETAPGQWEYSLESAPDIAILKFLQIGPSTSHELKKIEVELRSRSLKGIVLDLRNSSGTLHDVVTLADQLLDSGVLGRLRTRESMVTHTMQPGCLWKEIPLAALVEMGTGAGPTYLAAALQDSKRATIIGEIPESSAYVQSRIPLSDDSTLQLATGTLIRASGIELVSSIDDPTLRDRQQTAQVDQAKLNYLLPDYSRMTTMMRGSTSGDPSNAAPPLETVEIADSGIRTAVEVLSKSLSVKNAK